MRLIKPTGLYEERMKIWSKILSLLSIFATQESWAAEPVTRLKADEAVTLFPALG
jgi:hypothetical protein